MASAAVMASAATETTTVGPPVDADTNATAQAVAATPHQLSSSELIWRINEVCVQVARTTIPPEEKVKLARRVRPSVISSRFAEARAVEMEGGVTVQRGKELHKQMQRLRRKDSRNGKLIVLTNSTNASGKAVGVT